MNMKLGRDQLTAARVMGVPVRVVAGAGTGKTAVIAERFRRLVASGVSPASILVMTFTERAAAEMRERIESLVGAAAPWVGTFHSVALSWLREDGRVVGVPAGFRIVTGANRWILARELMWSIGDLALTGDERPDDLVGPVLQMLERMKQELIPLDRLERWARASDDQERGPLMLACVRLFRAYERECRKRRLLDFDDLLLLAVRMLETEGALLQRYAERYPHVLVDEYQDLNLAQERLVELVSGRSHPFVVGDDDQSIYRFRGASRASLERFLGSFTGTRTITLGRNRRSTRRIVASAARLIGHNPNRLSKELRSDLPGPAVELWQFAGMAGEAAAIAQEAAALVAGGVQPSSIAVLCRTNAFARPIAAALADRGVPHMVIGGHGFHDRPEVKDLIAMLRVVRNPGDAIALARPAAQAVQALLARLSEAAKTQDVRDLFFDLVEQSRYPATPSVVRFGELIAEFCEDTPDHSLEAFMRHLDLVLLSGEDEEPPALEMGEAVRVMTIHQSKGLEFDAVFVPSLVEGRLPQWGRSPRFELPPAVLEPLVRGREDVVAEERRLLYVAMTRARRRLYLTWAEHYEGGRRWRPSRFLAEMGLEATRVDVEQSSTAAPLVAINGHGGAVELAYSAIAMYRDCPRQYWYRHVANLTAPQSAEAVQGVILHEVLRRAGEQRRAGLLVTESSLHEIHDDVWGTTPFPDPRRAPAFRRNGAAELEAFRARGGLEAAPEYLEQPFSVAVQSSHSGWTLRGVIDRIDRTDEGWRIVDYKSGRALPRRRRDLQVALYALGAKAAMGLGPVELEVVYLASGDSVRVDGVEGLIRDAESEGSEVADGVRSGAFPARPERRRCRLCPYRLACAEAL